MSSEQILGLPDIGGLANLLNEAKTFFAEVQAFIEQLKSLYEQHKADIDAVIVFLKEAAVVVKQLVEFVRGLAGGTGGGFQAP